MEESLMQFVILFLAAIYAGGFLLPQVLRVLAEAERVEQREEPASPRMQALICWHEFEAGKRPTTADCPER
jgi:hypothetical protein